MQISTGTTTVSPGVYFLACENWEEWIRKDVEIMSLLTNRVVKFWSD